MNSTSQAASDSDATTITADRRIEASLRCIWRSSPFLERETIIAPFGSAAFTPIACSTSAHHWRCQLQRKSQQSGNVVAQKPW